jgi:hypothetical protein
MQQIADWLEKLGMSEYAQRFAGASRQITSRRTSARSSRNRPRRKLPRKSSGWDENQTFLEGDVLEVEYAMAAGC